MDLQLTTKAQEAVSNAVQLATRSGNPQVEPAHLLLALTEQTDTTTGPLLEAVGTSAQAVRATAEQAIRSLPAAQGASVAQPTMSRTLANVLEQARQTMESMGDTYVSTDHLLVALAKTGDFGLNVAK